MGNLIKPCHFVEIISAKILSKQHVSFDQKLGLLITSLTYQSLIVLFRNIFYSNVSPSQSQQSACVVYSWEDITDTVYHSNSLFLSLSLSLSLSLASFPSTHIADLFHSYSYINKSKNKQQLFKHPWLYLPQLDIFSVSHFSSLSVDFLRIVCHLVSISSTSESSRYLHLYFSNINMIHMKTDELPQQP